MKIFLIETENGIPKYDFGFTLLESIKYNNWYRNEEIYQWYPTDINLNSLNIEKRTQNKFIPIGSVEFVLKFLQKYYSVDNIKPINIPNDLLYQKYIKRYVISYIEGLGLKTSRIDAFPAFIKSADKIKGYSDIVKTKENLNNLNDDEYYFISSIKNINSEWRAFVYRNKLVGLQNYSGDFTIFPDINLILNMIKSYKNCPPAYTLDVAVNDIDGTFLIEVHNFFSCGLYGFSEHKILPQMFIESFYYMLSNDNKYNF